MPSISLFPSPRKTRKIFLSHAGMDAETKEREHAANVELFAWLDEEILNIRGALYDMKK